MAVPSEEQDRGLSHSYVSNALRSPATMIIVGCIIVAVLGAADKGAYIIVNTIVVGGMWALMAIGLALVFGVMNICNFAHGDFFMVGSLVAYFVFSPFIPGIMEKPNTLFSAVAPLVALFSGAVVCAFLGILCELFVFRPLRKRSRAQWVMNTFVLTIGISGFLVNGHQVIFGVQYRGIVNYWLYPSASFFGVYVSSDRILVFIIAILSITAFWLFMRFSKTGTAVSAVSQDETGALLVGVNLNAIQMITLALSCGLAGLAGASLLFVFPAYPTSGLGPLYNSWFIIILVGMGQVGGAVIGAFIVALLQVLTTVYVGEGWDYVIPTIIIAAILIFKPSGMFGAKVRTVLEE